MKIYLMEEKVHSVPVLATFPNFDMNMPSKVCKFIHYIALYCYYNFSFLPYRWMALTNQFNMKKMKN